MYIGDNEDLMREWDWDKNKALGLDPYKLKQHSNKKVWWICKNGHEWAESPDHRLRGCGCPYCSNRRILTGYNDLATLFPDLLKEWDYRKNAEMDPNNVVPGTAKKAWWICSKCGTEWCTEIRHRTQRQQGCPECAKTVNGKIRAQHAAEKNGLIQNERLMSEWNYEKNLNVTPEMVSQKSNQKVWWRCKSCGYEWLAAVNNRAAGRGCPCCSNKTVVEGVNDIATTKPTLAAEWHPTKNGDLSPQQVTIGSGRKVWWLCPNGHEYQAKIMDRGHGTNCPICISGRQTSFAEQAFFYYIKQVRPDAINRAKGIIDNRKELDIYIPSIRVAIEYDGSFWHKSAESYDKEKKKYLLCKSKKIRLIRIKEVMTRDRLDTADVIYGGENLDNKKNLDMLIRHVLDKLDPRSNMWTRTDPRYFHSPVDVNTSRDEMIIRQNMFNLLPTTNTKEYCIVEKSLGEVLPELASEWHPTKNGKLTPYMFKPNSSYRAWWKCSQCGNEWQTAIGHRANGTGCMNCFRVRNRAEHKLSKKIYQYSIQGEFIKEWVNISAAARELHANKANIVMCATHKRPTAAGYRWEFEKLERLTPIVRKKSGPPKRKKEK